MQLVRENTDPAGGGADADPEKEEVSPRWHPQVRTPASTGTLRGSTCPRVGLQGSVARSAEARVEDSRFS